MTSRWVLALALHAAALGYGLSSRAAEPKPAALADLKRALTFHAPFDGTADAHFAMGDPKIYWASSMKHPRTGSPGLPENRYVTLAPQVGRFGDALQFHKKVPDMVFFQGNDNLPYRSKDWEGTISLWLKLDPETDLEPGYSDPIQITTRDWNDAAFFVEFEKDEKPRHFRYGAYADFKVWNPDNRDWDKIPIGEKPLVVVPHPPFSRDRWTHVVFTFARFNTGEKNGTASLFLNGKHYGTLPERQQTFTWDPPKSLIMLGLSYIGLMDDLGVFNRALTPGEVQTVYELKRGLRALRE